MINLLNDRSFEFMLNTIKQIKGLHKSDPVKLRRFLEGICFIAKGGCQWRLLPEDYGNWSAVHKRFKQWEKKGIWELIFNDAIIDPDMEYIMIDSSSVRAHSCAAGLKKNSRDEQALGCSAGGFTTKIHCVTEALGLPLKFSLTGGQRHDITQAPFLTQKFKGIPLLADKAYCSHPFMDALIEKECTPIIHSRENSKKQINMTNIYIEKDIKLSAFLVKLNTLEESFLDLKKVHRLIWHFYIS